MTKLFTGWLLILLTIVVLIVLKELHLAVTHYNLFLIILLLWSGMVITVFRTFGITGRDFGETG
ncbi:MAG: hypothetical protein K9J81_02855 [Desulfohalobiaceae bacterium]|nr:hypothetical protein [Desulfohalobiaceae bacterium]